VNDKYGCVMLVSDEDMKACHMTSTRLTLSVYNIENTGSGRANMITSHSNSLMSYLS